MLQRSLAYGDCALTISVADKGPTNKVAYIDAVRGWAILLVITCHVGDRFSEMPYPVKKLTNFGWHGVQMFFLASAVTLMMSWVRKKEPFLTASKQFFIRRFLRIAPMYYLGALIYAIAEPPDSGFDLAQLLRSLLFVNAWHPDWIPTTRGWMVVPGGWSIGVEFTFYALFPVLATLLTSLNRALLFAVAAVAIAITANSWGSISFLGCGDIPVRNFLYFWFPNQLPIFALGIVLYHVIVGKYEIDLSRNHRVVGASLALIVGVWVLLAERPITGNSFHSFLDLPTVFWASLSFMAFIFILSKGGTTIFAHSWMQKLGELSFSSYVLHFFFVRFIPDWSGGLIDTGANGFRAIGMLVLLWLASLITTVATASVAHRLIEQPGIDLARRLTSRYKAPAQALINAQAEGLALSEEPRVNQTS